MILLAVWYRLHALYTFSGRLVEPRTLGFLLRGDRLKEVNPVFQLRGNTPGKRSLGITLVSLPLLGQLDSFAFVDFVSSQ